MKRRMWLVGLVLALCWVLRPDFASAVELDFIESGESVTAFGSGFDVSFPPPSGVETVTFTDTFLSSSIFSGSGVAVLLESAGLVSDRVDVNFHLFDPGVMSLTATFTSDADPAGLPGIDPAFLAKFGLLEDGTLQDLSGRFFDPATGLAVSLPPELTIKAQSDVPEPSALLLVGVGLFALRLLQRQKLGANHPTS